MQKPFSPSADRNKEAILAVLKQEVSAGQTVLEIGSGTGQHACYFASEMPELVWQPTELEANIKAMKSRTDEHMLGNVRSPIALDVREDPWPKLHADRCYTCNTLHIISMESVTALFKGCCEVLGDSGKLCVYGPFTIDGQHNSPSNADFDRHLKASDPASGVRDLTQLDSIAQRHYFSPYRLTPMPANNYFVVWEKATPN